MRRWGTIAVIMVVWGILAAAIHITISAFPDHCTVDTIAIRGDTTWTETMCVRSK